MGQNASTRAVRCDGCDGCDGYGCDGWRYDGADSGGVPFNGCRVHVSFRVAAFWGTDRAKAWNAMARRVI